jgi:16S rRNA (guanine527-N7)-methyltransferase
MIVPEELFEAPLPGLRRPLTRTEGDLVVKYLEILKKWQRTQRLVGSIEPAWLIDNIIVDSIAFLAGVPDGAASLVDIGSGAGVPGIPISIVNPDLAVSLVEAKGRRASFLATVIREIGLERTVAIHSRAEALGDEYRDRFDVAVMRCVGQEPVLTGAMRLVRPGGMVVVSAPPASISRRDEGGELITVEARHGARAFYRYTKPEISAFIR